MKYKFILILAIIILLKISNILAFESVIIDQNGKRVGYDSVTGQTITELPKSCYMTGYSDESGQPYRLLNINDAVGNGYLLYVIGKDTESFKISMRSSYSPGDLIIEGTVHPNQMIKYFVNPSAINTNQIFIDTTSPEFRTLGT